MARLPVMVAEARFPSETGEQRIGGQRPVFTGTPQQPMTGEALVRAGAGITEVATTGLKIEKDARDQSDVNAAMSESTRELDKYTTELEADPDYKSREQKFAVKADEIKARYADKLSGHGQLMYDEQLRRRYDTFSHTVRAKARGDEVEQYAINMEAANDADLTAAHKVKGTSKERILLDGIKERVDEAVRTNVISKDKGDQYYKATLEKYSKLKVEALIRTNPAAAIRMADDPEQTPYLKANDREALKLKAQTRAESLSQQGYAVSRDTLQYLLKSRESGAPWSPEKQRAWDENINRVPPKQRALYQADMNREHRVDNLMNKIDVPVMQRNQGMPPPSAWDDIYAATAPAGPAAVPGAAPPAEAPAGPASLPTIRARIDAAKKSGDFEQIRDAEEAEKRLFRREAALAPGLERDVNIFKARGFKGEDVSGEIEDLKKRAFELRGKAGADMIESIGDISASIRAARNEDPASVQGRIAAIRKTWFGGERNLELHQLEAIRELQIAYERKHAEFVQDPKQAAYKYNQAAKEADEKARGVRPLDPPEWDEAAKSDAERRSEQRRASDLAALETQARNGVLPSQQRITTKAFADQYLSMFNNAKGVDDKIALINNLRGQFREDMYPRVMAEIFHEKKVPGDITLLANIPTWAKSAQVNAANAYRGDITKMKELAGGSEAFKSLQRDLVAIAGPTMRSFFRGNDPGTATSFMDGMEQMGVMHMANGDDAPTAARKAFMDALGSYSEMLDTTRIPVVQGRPVASAKDVGMIQQYMQHGGGLTAANLRLPPKGVEDSMLTDKERWPIYLDNIKQGYWVTTADEKGYGLFTRTGVPVYDRFGAPVIVLFDEKPSAAARDYWATRVREEDRGPPMLLGTTPRTKSREELEHVPAYRRGK